jgi:hypothetical protein
MRRTFMHAAFERLGGFSAFADSRVGTIKCLTRSESGILRLQQAGIYRPQAAMVHAAV